MKELTSCTYYVDCDGRDILSIGSPGQGWGCLSLSSEIVTSESCDGAKHHVVIRERGVTGENYFQGFSPPAFAETGAKNVRGDAGEKYS